MPDYFDPHVVSRIKGLELRSLRLVESLMVGFHKSKLRGISTDFAQHRAYVFGDDTKHLDWKVYAKTDRFFVKEYEAETNMAVTFFLDMSGSMFFQSEDAAMSKFDYGATIAATLAFLLMDQKDTFGLALFHEKVHSFLSPKGTTTHFRNMLDVMEKTEPGGKTDIGKALMTVAPRLKSRGLVIVVSDCVDESSELSRALGLMSFHGHDVVLFHIEDPIERDFPFTGQTIFKGLEDEGRLLCNPEDLRRSYLRERQLHLDGIHDVCTRFRFEMGDVQTDMRLDTALSAFLAARLARRRRV